MLRVNFLYVAWQKAVSTAAEVKRFLDIVKKIYFIENNAHNFYTSVTCISSGISCVLHVNGETVLPFKPHCLNGKLYGI